MFLGSVMRSETTAAAAGAVGELRFDPFAMLPFCGYNMGDYFAHWLSIGRARRRQAAEDLLRQLVPQGAEGKFLWPGFGENSRVLAWVFAPLRRPRRRGGDADRLDPAVGGEGIERAAWTSPRRTWPSCCAWTSQEWRAQLPQFREHSAKFDHLPDELDAQLKALEARWLWLALGRVRASAPRWPGAGSASRDRVSSPAAAGGRTPRPAR